MVLIILQATTVALLAGVWLWRVRRARINAPAGKWFDPAWVAAGFAVLGLLTTLNTIPAWRWMDQAFSAGGPDRNMWALAQALCAMSSFWFFRNALLNVVTLRSPVGAERSPIRTRLPFLILPLALVTIFFMMIRHRGETDPFFVDLHLNDPALTTALTIYMLTVVFLASDSAQTLLGNWRIARLPYLGGTVMVITACAADLAYCWVGAAKGSTHTTDALFLAFEILFYPGILFMTLGYCTLVIFRLDPAFVLPALRLGKITDLYRRTYGDLGKFPSLLDESRVAGTARGALEYCYRCLVEIHNLEVEHKLVLQPRDREYVESVASRLNARLATDHGIRPEGAPWAITKSIPTRGNQEHEDTNDQRSVA